jgi:hypothetical protein
MSLKTTDAFLVPADALAYIELKEEADGLPLAKVEVLEYFFEWLRLQPAVEQISLLRNVLKDEH